MNHHESSTETVNNRHSDAVSLSQVSPKRKKNSRIHFYWLVGGVCAVLLVAAVSTHHSSPEKEPPTSPLSVDRDYGASLEANLARLRALQEKNVNNNNPSAQGISLPPTKDFSAFAKDSVLKKEIIARQNAPTSMYSAPEKESVLSHVSSVAPTETLAEPRANANFANTASKTTTLEAHAISHPGYTIAAGELVQAVLETAIHSDLPGLVRAVVSQPVYAYTGERVLIPAGSRLMGQYTSSVMQGQQRVMIVWNRVLLPNGVAVQLNSPSTDALGQAGQGADDINTHFLARFGESALLSIIGAGTATLGVGNQDPYNSTAQYRMALSQSFQQSAGQSLHSTHAIKPTLRLDQGAKINVFVAHDLSFYAVLKKRALR